MKKFLIGLVGVMAMSGLANAAYINCLPTNVNVITNSTVVIGATATCGTNGAALGGSGNLTGNNTNNGVTGTAGGLSIVAPAGFLITGIEIKYTGTFQDSSGSNVAFAVHFSGSEQSPDFNIVGVPFDVSETAPGSGIGGATVYQGSATFAGVASLNAFTFGFSAGPGSNPLPDNASATASFQIQLTQQQTGVPEPSTFAMLGLALTGVGVYARRRKA